MRIWFLKSFVVLAVMVFSGFAHAETNDSKNFAGFTNEVSAAIGSGDVDLIASIVANTIDKNPDLSQEVLNFIFSNYADALPAIITAVQNISPDNTSNVFSLVTNMLEECSREDDELGNCPSNDLLLARIFSAINPAGGGRVNSNNIPDFVRNQGVNPGGIQLPNAVRENPNVISGN